MLFVAFFFESGSRMNQSNFMWGVFNICLCVCVYIYIHGSVAVLRKQMEC